MRFNSTSFTYIEVLIAIAVIGILFVPMMQLFSRGLYSATVSGDKITAVNLARWEMEKIKNINLTKFMLKQEGDAWKQALDEPPLAINKAKWRIFKHIDIDQDPLYIKVEVFLSNDLKKPLASLETLIEDNIWVENVAPQV